MSVFNLLSGQRGKICKPYNSVLGEHFRAHWLVKEVTYPPEYPKVPPLIDTHLHHPHAVAASPDVSSEGDEDVPKITSDAISMKSSKSTGLRQPTLDRGGSSINSGTDSGFLSASGGDKKMAASEEDVSRLGEGLEKMTVEFSSELDDPDEFQDAEEEVGEGEGVKVVFLTEQISHHPPASSYYFLAPQKGVEAAGVDQISAKVSGTSESTAPWQPRLS